MQSHKQHARRRARTAQLAAGVGVAATLAIAVLPLHAALTRRAEPVTNTGPADVKPVEGPAPEPLDKAWVTNIFSAVGPDAVAAPAPPDQIATGPAETDPVEPEPIGDETITPNTRWQYLGSIATSRGRSALLRDTLKANQQHLVAEGKEIEGFTVRRVTPSHVILADTNGPTQVDRAPVSSSWSAPAAAAAPPVRAAAANQAQQRANARVNPAMANRTRAGRTTAKDLDPEVARQLREQLFQGNLDLDRLNELQKAGVIDDATAQELVVQFKEVQGLSEEEYAEIREKLRQ